MRRSILPFVSLLVACVTDTPVPEAFFEGEIIGLPDSFPPARDDMLPPPMTLSADPIVPGQVFYLIANGVNPGDTVYFVRSGTLGTLCAPALGGACLDIEQPVVMGSSVAGPAGIATFSVNVPRLAPIGITMHFQAGVLGSNGYVSNPQTRVSEGLCGDGILTADEECDDGNILNGDGCTDACTADRCGDGVLQQGEACDDGNNDPGDGCSPTCEIDCCVDEFAITVHSAIISELDSSGDLWDEAALFAPFTDPDAYVQVIAGGNVIGETLVNTDTLTPQWNASFNVSVSQGQAVRFTVVDEDLVFDEDIETFVLNWQDLNDMRDAGQFSLDGAYVTDFLLEINTVP